MNTDDIINSIMIGRYARNFVVPNYTPKGWWECDVFELTRAGYFREYEVKVTRGDFFADSHKSKTDWDAYAKTRSERLAAGGNDVTLPSECVMNKHASVAKGLSKGPCQFWYVTPRDLVTVDEVPEWAGLIYITKNYTELSIKAAPKLHNVKADTTIVAHAKGVCYWRFHNLRAKEFKSKRLAKL